MKIRLIQSGMTLIELLTSIAVIALISTLFIANYHSNIRRTDIIMTSQTAVSDIRQAQANALGLLEYQGEVPAGGWGIFFSTTASSTYTIFADNNSNRRFDVGEDNVVYGGRTVQLPATIRVDQISLGNAVNTVHIVFLPPDPTTLISQAGGTAFPWVTVRLRETVSSSTKTIRINFLGLAEVID